MRKQIFFPVLILMALIFLCSFTLFSGTIEKNITFARQYYKGTDEEVLIALLTDETQPPDIRTHKAVWTLGRIRSKAALPYLEAYYKNDPKGKTCKGKHEILICQYEIYKAILRITE